MVVMHTAVRSEQGNDDPEDEGHKVPLRLVAPFSIVQPSLSFAELAPPEGFRLRLSSSPLFDDEQLNLSDDAET